MKEHPILFSGPMVRAILAGAKTETRRVIKPQPPELEPVFDDRENGIYFNDETGHLVELRCPYGVPGDRLWVKETFCLSIDSASFDMPPPEYVKQIGREEAERTGILTYRASDPNPDFDGDGPYWTPSIFMPRAFSRLTLEITSVRAEKVQEITVEGALREGVKETEFYEPFVSEDFELQSYRYLWDSLNGKTHPWESNPWVWVVRFQHLEAPHG